MTDPKKVIALLASDQDGEVVAAARALVRMAAAANLPITEFLITRRDAKAADTMQRFAWKPNPRAAEPRTYVPAWKKLYEAIMAAENADKINSWERLFLASIKIHDASFLSTKQMAALQRIADKIGVKV